MMESMKELKQQIANLSPLQRAQILRFYPHLSTPKNDNEPLLCVEELEELKARRDQLYLDITANDELCISNKGNHAKVDKITEQILHILKRGN